MQSQTPIDRTEALEDYDQQTDVLCQFLIDRRGFEGVLTECGIFQGHLYPFENYLVLITKSLRAIIVSIYFDRHGRLRSLGVGDLSL